MAQQTINIGTAVNDGTGDPVRSAFNKTNLNFTEVYADLAGKAPVSHTHLATSISDSSPAGRAVLTAADEPAQRTALGLGALATKSSVATSDLADGAATNVKLAPVATATVKGRASPALGVVEDLTMADMVGLLDAHFGGTSWRSSGSGVTIGSVPPTTAPAASGALYVDTTNNVLYVATGTATVADWTELLSSASGATIAAKGTPVSADKVVQFDSGNGDAPVTSTWTQIIAALRLVVLDASNRLDNPKSVYTSYDGGTPAAASTYTPAAANGNMQHLVNNAAFTLAPQANPGVIVIEIVNGASAGAITTSGFTKVTGDAFTTTNGKKFVATCRRTNTVSDLNIVAMP